MAKRLVGLVVILVLALVMFGAGWTVAKIGTGSAVDPGSLTDRERQVLQLVAEGKTAKEIAAIDATEFPRT